MPGRATHGTLKIIQAQRQGELLGSLQVNQRGEEIVPDDHEGKEGDHRQRRPGEGKDHAEEDSELAAAVDSGGFGQIFRDGQKELAKKEDAERRAKPGGHPERLECAEPGHACQIAQSAEDGEERDHGDGEWNHHGREHDDKQHAAAAKLNLGEAVGDDGAGEGGACHGQDGDNHCIAGPEQKSRVVASDHLQIVARDHRLGQNLWRKED